MGVESKTLHKWYKEYLSGFNPKGEQEIHKHDIKVLKGEKELTIEVPILRKENVGQDMGIDEKLIGEQWYTLLTNRQTGKIAFCAATTQSSSLQQAMLPFDKSLHKIKTITRDMSGSYSNLCKTLIPDAEQIIDKFHVIKNLMDAQQAVRIKYRQQILEQRRKALQSFKEEETKRMETCEKLGDKFKANKFRYNEQHLSNGDTISELLAKSHFLLYKYPHQWEPWQAKRATLLFEIYPEIEKSYLLSCSFRKWYAQDNIGKHILQIEKELFQWYQDVEDSNIDEMLNFKSLVESHEKEILAYFVKGHTNAIAENRNGKIKKFIASNQGVRNRSFFFFRLANFFT
jgi:transposase